MLLTILSLLCLSAAHGAMRFPDSNGASSKPNSPPLPLKFAGSTSQTSVAFPEDHVEDHGQGRDHYVVEDTEEDNGRLFSLFPSIANGMQIGLDLRLPFLNVPYGRLLSGLSSGGASSLLTGTGSSLASMLLGGMLFFPKILSSVLGDSQYRGAGDGTDDMIRQVNKFLVHHNVDAESCLQTALCVLGQVHSTSVQSRHGHGDSSTATDILDSMLNLASIKKSLSKSGLREARDYGATGGDCHSLGTKCPVSVDQWHRMIRNLDRNL